MANDITSWSTTPANNTTLDSLTWAEGQTAASVNNSARQMMASTKAWYNDLSGAKAGGGTANAITLTSDVGFGTLANGRRVVLIPGADNTGATTLNVNALGTKSVRVNGDFPCTGGEIREDCPAEFIYNTALNSAAGGWLLTNPATNQRWGKGVDVASASSLTLGNDGNYFDITGTTTITSIATKGVGTIVKLHFDAALTLTHNATDLVLPGGANITTAAGDEAEFIEYASGDWRCTNYQKAATPLPVWEDVGVFNPTSTLSLDVTGLSAYSMIRVEGYLVPTTDSTQLGLRTSTNNGSSFDGGASDYSWTGHFSNGSSVATSADADDTWISLSVGNANIGNVTTEGVHLDLLMTRFNASNHMILSGVVTVIRDNGSVMPMQVGGKRLSTSARDAFQFRFNTGNIAVGKISVRGLRG